MTESFVRTSDIARLSRARLKQLAADGYAFRDVLFNIVARDLKIKYKRTFLGYLWSLLNPILQLTVMAFVFSHIVRLGIRDYTLFLFSGLLAWGFFQSSMLLAVVSFTESENFLKKIYVPKIYFPLSKVVLRAIDFAFSLLALLLIGAVVGFPLHATMLLLPVPMVLLFLFTLGAAILVAIATVYFRDVQYLVGVFLQLLYFATPILYPLSVIPEHLQPYFRLNPLYPLVSVFQRLIYDGVVPTGAEWVAAGGASIAVFLAALGLLLLVDDELVFRL